MTNPILKSILLRTTLPLLLAITPAARAQTVTTPNASPRGGVSQVIGITMVAVDYGRPYVNKREVWGKLVPYGFNDLNFGTSKAAPWRAGANENTTVTFAHDVKINGSPLAAGAYGLFMAVAEDGTATWIFSKDADAWGSFYYDLARDALRVATKWEDTPHHEMLTYEFSAITKNSADLALSWEKKRFPMTITVDTDAVVVANLKRELANSKSFEYQAWINASQYLVQNNLDLNLALEWAEQAIRANFIGQRNFATLSNKAQILEKLGRATEAEPLMQEALKFGNAGQIHQYGRRLIAAKKPQQALAVFKFNAERFPGVWPVNYGLARGYSAVGDYPAALEALLKAQQNVPAGDTVNAAAIVTNIEKLKRGEDIN